MRLFSVSKTRLVLASAAVLLSLSHISFADTITSSALPTTVLAPSSDSLTLNAGAVSFTSGSGPFVFQTGEFNIGYSPIPDQVIPFSFQESLTLNGITQLLTISGQDMVTDTVDELTIFAGAPVVFGSETFTLQPFDLASENLGDSPVNLQATVAPAPTPEPGSFVLLGTGIFGGAAFFARKTRFGLSTEATGPIPRS